MFVISVWRSGELIGSPAFPTKAGADRALGILRKWEALAQWRGASVTTKYLPSW